MNKPLLLGSALLVAISAYPQNGRLSKPSGVLDFKSKQEQTENISQQSSTVTGPVRKLKSFDNTNAKVSAISAARFTGSMNMFSYLVSQSKTLCYTPGVNIVSFIARKSPYYTASSNSNSGAIVASISTNAGATWDSTCIWTNATNLARYPQGGVYNPAGNTNKNSAYVVGMGPYTAGGWDGNWYASKTLNGAGNNTPGADQQTMSYSAPTLKKHYMSRYSFTSIEGGLVRSMAMVINDPAATTNLAFGLRGALMAKGQFNAGAFVWSVDTFIPATTMNTGGWKNLSGGGPLAAWSESGQIGYVVLLGSRATETLSATRVSKTGGYQPIVYKTTNSGVSWSLLPAEDFSNYAKFRGLNDRLYPISTNTTLLIPNFTNNEGNDVTVDVNGNLHFVTNLSGHYSNHVDSLGYRYVFGTEQYSYGSGPFDYPVIYDFYTSSTGGWNYHMVDSFYSEGPGTTPGTDPGANYNPWANGADKVAYDARIQVSRSIDGKKIIYSWSETDTSIGGTKWNIYPDIMMRGYDVTIDKVTPTSNVTGGLTATSPDILSGAAYFHYMSNKAIGSSTACIEMPFTCEMSGTLDGLQAVNSYYIKGADLCPASFTVNPMRPTGINAVSKNDVNVQVINFPNPATESTTIVVGLKDAVAFEIAIYNAVGQVIDTYKVNGQAGNNQINIDLSSYAKGVYLYNVKVGGSTITKKLIVD